MNKVPRLVIVNDSEYRVIQKKLIRDGGNTNISGLADEALKTIFILKSLCLDEKFITLAHELLHIMEFEYNLKIPHATIYKLERPFAEFIRHGRFIF